MVIFCVGEQGEGKSHFCVNYITKSKQDYLYFNKSNCTELFTVVPQKKRIICVDDAQSYLPFNVHDKKVKHILGLLSERRWKEYTFLCCFHRFEQIPSWLIGYVDRYIIFKNKKGYETGSKMFDPILNKLQKMEKYSYLVV